MSRKFESRRAPYSFEGRTRVHPEVLPIMNATTPIALSNDMYNDAEDTPFLDTNRPRWPSHTLGPKRRTRTRKLGSDLGDDDGPRHFHSMKPGPYGVARPDYPLIFGVNQQLTATPLNGLPTADMPIDPHEPRYCYCNQVSWGEVCMFICLVLVQR